MQLSEALLLRSDLLKSLRTLETLISSSLVVPEGEEAPNDPGKLLEEHDIESKKLAQLLADINLTNANNTLDMRPGSQTITEALTRRDYLKDLVALLESAASNSVPSAHMNVYTDKEVREVPVIDGAALRCQAGDASRELRQLTIALERVGWTTTLERCTPGEAAR